MSNETYQLDNTASEFLPKGPMRLVDANGNPIPGILIPTMPTTLGNYVLHRDSGGVYTWLATALPTLPTDDGSYVLKVLTGVYTWVAES